MASTPREAPPKASSLLASRRLQLRRVLGAPAQPTPSVANQIDLAYSNTTEPPFLAYSPVRVSTPRANRVPFTDPLRYTPPADYLSRGATSEQGSRSRVIPADDVERSRSRVIPAGEVERCSPSRLSSASEPVVYSPPTVFNSPRSQALSPNGIVIRPRAAQQPSWDPSKSLPSGREVPPYYSPPLHGPLVRLHSNWGEEAPVAESPLDRVEILNRGAVPRELFYPNPGDGRLTYYPPDARNSPRYPRPGVAAPLGAHPGDGRLTNHPPDARNSPRHPRAPLGGGGDGHLSDGPRYPHQRIAAPLGQGGGDGHLPDSTVGTWRRAPTPALDHRTAPNPLLPSPAPRASISSPGRGRPNTEGGSSTGRGPNTGGGASTGRGPNIGGGPSTKGGPNTGGGSSTGRGPNTGGGPSTGRGPNTGGGGLRRLSRPPSAEPRRGNAGSGAQGPASSPTALKRAGALPPSPSRDGYPTLPYGTGV